MQAAGQIAVSGDLQTILQSGVILRRASALRSGVVVIVRRRRAALPVLIAAMSDPQKPTAFKVQH
jgi:hypothetical protein